MLQQYLNANLLSITEDADFSKLKKSSEELAKKIIKNKVKIVSYALAAIDPNVPATNPEIIEAKEIISGNWKTFNNNTKDTPFTYVRAVILDALKIVTKDLNTALLVWFASRNIIKYYSLTGNEKVIILDFLTELGKEINVEANRLWTLSRETPATKVELKLSEIGNYGIHVEYLQKYLEDASGPTNSENVANFESPNKHWTSVAPHWSYEFAPRAAKGIKAVVDTSLKSVVTSVVANQKIMQTAIETIATVIKTEVSEKDGSLKLRSDLLWWKEASYSPTVDKSYRDVDHNVIEIVLAKDYASFVPIFYPKSADYFFKETYLSLKNIKQEEIELTCMITNLQDHSDELKEILPEATILTDKITLLGYLTGIIWGKYQLAQFEELLGFSPTIKLMPAELTLWLFHDFQLLKAVNAK